MQPSKFQIWLMAIRPKTLWAAVAPVLIGTAMAHSDSVHHWPSAFGCLLGALLIQILVNLTNDYFDFKKGADKNRVGPTRVMQAKLMTPKTMKIAIRYVFFAACLVCIYLVKRGGLPIFVIGAFSLLLTFLYTAGPFPLAYLGLGEIFVFIFFGPVAVAGTYYVQALEFNRLTLIAGIAPGLLSVALLTINNLRDIETDKHVHKRTLAVRLGKDFAAAEYFLCILGASTIPVLLYLMTQDYLYCLAASSIAFLSYPSLKIVFTHKDAHTLNDALIYTGRLLLIYSVLFSLGWIL